MNRVLLSSLVPPVFLVAACAATKQPGVAKAEWELVWADEFERDGAPDPTKWGYEVGFVRNNELQYYTKDRRENVRVAKGKLIIEARKESWPNAAYVEGSDNWATSKQQASYTSGSVHTRGKVDWTHGRFEVRAKLPRGRGMWPAAWMLGCNIDEVGWPMCGEIDFMEYVGFDPGAVYTTVHTNKYNHVLGTHRGKRTNIARPHATYHVYAFEWCKESIEFFVDGKSVFEFKNDGSGVDVWPYDKPHYLILNSAVGGVWGGQEGVDDTIFPTRYMIDYVRVYRQRE